MNKTFTIRDFTGSTLLTLKYTRDEPQVFLDIKYCVEVDYIWAGIPSEKEKKNHKLWTFCPLKMWGHYPETIIVKFHKKSPFHRHASFLNGVLHYILRCSDSEKGGNLFPRSFLMLVRINCHIDWALALPAPALLCTTPQLLTHNIQFQNWAVVTKPACAEVVTAPHSQLLIQLRLWVTLGPSGRFKTC